MSNSDVANVKIWRKPDKWTEAIQEPHTSKHKLDANWRTETLQSMYLDVATAKRAKSRQKTTNSTYTSSKLKSEDNRIKKNDLNLDPVAKLAKSLASRVDELLHNSLPFELFSQTKLDEKSLERARMRLWDQWQNILLSTSSGPDVKMTAIANIEISRAAVTIAYAAVNSLQADWDVDRYLDCAKVSPNPLNANTQQRQKLAKYFKAPSLPWKDTGLVSAGDIGT
ncbi:hypothetical protein DFJ58DRAFT_842441 [Suillus subalutaceus]|uniref:uncharacterized protein n=1 Tax=Suillus subalutaceus TaxID=48586 RepID=UPI001B862698|nr:uncharacterized protein DFJ58DRAFT_842441 [Suillus subalutaceus]KAG1850366.1 hypothetical protein DFJ58DRAFT_842441 [Suillus subalutaceus]